MSNRFPFASFPRGWFQVAYADELGPEAVLPLRCFGRDLVLFRSAAGVARAFDAHCPHLGAHLGYGGTVCDETLRCPFHGWRFGGDGRCVDAGGAPKLPVHSSLKAWPLEEVNGAIFVHHGDAGSDRVTPAWRVPAVEELSSKDWVPYRRAEWRIRTHVQEIAENLVDGAHFRWVHGAASTPQTRLEVHGHQLRSLSTMKQRSPAGPVDAAITIDGAGLGFWAARFTGIVEVRLLITNTPLEEELVASRLSFAIRAEDARTRPELAQSFIDEVVFQVDQDVPIWEHKIYRTKPALAAGDGPIAQLRKWSRQFLEP